MAAASKASAAQRSGMAASGRRHGIGAYHGENKAQASAISNDLGSGSGSNMAISVKVMKTKRGAGSISISMKNDIEIGGISK